MHRIVGLLPGGEVATRVAAIRGSDLQSVIVINVAACTGHIGVPVGKRKTSRSVVESDDGPGDGALVAVVAICSSKRGPCSRVRRIGGLLPSSEVAAGSAAICRANLQIVIVVDMARLASEIRVAVG